MGLGGSHEVPGIEPKWVVCKVNAHPDVLLLQLRGFFFRIKDLNESDSTALRLHLAEAQAGMFTVAATLTGRPW